LHLVFGVHIFDHNGCLFLGFLLGRVCRLFTFTICI
jgi:hypothetical protein